MWYFAYGSNLNSRAVADWCRQGGLRAIQMKDPRPAVLDNYRLCFPIFSEYWQGGTADIVYDPGKSVAGALFSLSEADMKLIDQKIDRRLDNAGKEVGIYRRIDVKVSPLGKGDKLSAVTYQGTRVDKDHVPPTQLYMDLLIQGAYSHGLSMMWIAYLQSFTTQAARTPKPKS
ncbi:hypothetical protein BH09PLA1_BH09PLA1_20930 [soil metagenome]